MLWLFEDAFQLHSLYMVKKPNMISSDKMENMWMNMVQPILKRLYSIFLRRLRNIVKRACLSAEIRTQYL